MTLAWSLPCLVLLGAVAGAGADWRWWAMPALVLLVHDLAHVLAHGFARRATAARLPDHAASLTAVLVATACSTAAWQWQAGAPSLPIGILDGAGSAIAPVLPWLLPALLLGAPVPCARTLLRRHAGFAICCLVAALAATRHESVGPWLQFLLACIGASLLARLDAMPLHSHAGPAAAPATQPGLPQEPTEQRTPTPLPGTGETTSPR